MARKWSQRCWRRRVIEQAVTVAARHKRHGAAVRAAEIRADARRDAPPDLRDEAGVDYRYRPPSAARSARFSRGSPSTHVAPGDAEPVAAADVVACDHDAIAMIAPFRFADVAEAVEATAPVGLPLAPVLAIRGRRRRSAVRRAGRTSCALRATRPGAADGRPRRRRRR